jgi:hypothetical protein
MQQEVMKKTLNSSFSLFSLQQWDHHKPHPEDDNKKRGNLFRVLNETKNSKNLLTTKDYKIDSKLYDFLCCFSLPSTIRS